MNESLKFAKVFGALGSEQRLEIVRLLLRAGPEGMSVGRIQAKLEIPNSTLSHHLEKLRQEGLLDTRKDKQWIWHSINMEAVGRLVSFLCARCYNPELLQPLFTRIQNQCGQETKRSEDGNVQEDRVR